jgi:hypothetical protein
MKNFKVNNNNDLFTSQLRTVEHIGRKLLSRFIACNNNSRFPVRCLVKSNILSIGPALTSNDWFPIHPKPQLSSMNRRIDDYGY